MTESVYRGIDACHLELAITALEQQGVRGAESERQLSTLLRDDSAHVVRSTVSPDTTERVRPGTDYTPTCVRRIEEDRAGYLHSAPLRLVTTGDNLYARDLHARDSLLLATYPDRAIFLLSRAEAKDDAPLKYLRLNRDSVVAAWRAGY